MKAGVLFCRSPAVLIMRIYYGTVDNECNVHALVGGIIHQVGQVAEAKDCNSIELSSFQSVHRRDKEKQLFLSLSLSSSLSHIHKRIRKSENGEVHAAAQREETRGGPVGV